MIDLTQQLMSLNGGKPITQNDPDGKKDRDTGVVSSVPLTLRDAMLTGLLYGTLITGRVWEALDPASVA